MLADSIRTIIESQRIKNDRGEDLDRVTISLGVSQYNVGEELPAFIERADACLYASKSNGRNCTTGERQLNTH